MSSIARMIDKQFQGYTVDPNGNEINQLCNTLKDTKDVMQVWEHERTIYTFYDESQVSVSGCDYMFRDHIK